VVATPRRVRPIERIPAGPHHEFNDAVSIVVLCDDQAELDRYWNALLEGGGKPQACGWLVDRFAMLKMVKLDIAALEKAHRS
jgi:predicted 3-demethylubiquinone-9 3-methyltransferase (glyoxalase superfamily)